MLLLLTSCALNNDWKKALPAAASIELVHNFSLIHDDIQDKSQYRRNRPTLWVNWGIPQAINAGDTMFTLAQLSMLQLVSDYPTQIVVEASRLLNQACISLTYGQYLDLSYEEQVGLRVGDYWPMIEGKTAALLSCSAELGALLSSAPAETVAKLRQFGHDLGLAFQVQDDFLGIWGDASQTGKSTSSDLVSGKKTLPILYCLEQKGAFEKRWSAGPITVEEVPELEELMKTEGAYGYTVKTVDRLTRSALDNLINTIPQNDGLDALIELTNILLHRQY
jgi:geranylgeranyl diphosphate synthase type I